MNLDKNRPFNPEELPLCEEQEELTPAPYLIVETLVQGRRVSHAFQDVDKLRTVLALSAEELENTNEYVYISLEEHARLVMQAKKNWQQFLDDAAELASNSIAALNNLTSEIRDEQREVIDRA